MSLRKIDQNEWFQRIVALPAKLRHHTAVIVWWDFFADKRFNSRWTSLDGMLFRNGWFRYDFKQLNDEDLKRGLILAGYPDKLAEKRVNNDKCMLSYR